MPSPRHPIRNKCVSALQLWPGSPCSCFPCSCSVLGFSGINKTREERSSCLQISAHLFLILSDSRERFQAVHIPFQSLGEPGSFILLLLSCTPRTCRNPGRWQQPGGSDRIQRVTEFTESQNPQNSWNHRIYRIHRIPEFPGFPRFPGFTDSQNTESHNPRIHRISELTEFTESRNSHNSQNSQNTE